MSDPPNRSTPLPEAWLRGTVEGVPPLLQPVAHALLQARDEVEALMAGFPDRLLAARPAGVASPGFHLRHMAGVLDRLPTYARGEALTDAQREALAAEGAGGDGAGAVTGELVARFGEQVERVLEQLRATDERELTAAREVGRARLPSTVQGLLFHAAEHTMRHLGQLLVTVRVVREAAMAEEAV
jgi:hypothetical protein